MYAYAESDPVNGYDPLGLSTDYGFRGFFLVYETINNTHSIGPIDTAISARNAIKATTQSRKFAKQNGLSGGDERVDAYRHCYLACSSATSIGEKDSRKLLNNHEAINLLQGASPGDVRMDLFNNELGLECGAKINSGSPVSCQQACTSQFLKGNLNGNYQNF